MASPPEKLIIDRLVANLSAITVANGYKTDVDLVSRRVSTEDTAPRLGDVVLGVVFESTAFTAMCFDAYRCRMTLAIACWVKASTEDALHDDLIDLQDDLIAAEMSDHTLNGNCINIEIQDWRDARGDQDNQQTSGVWGWALQRIVVEYERSTALS